MDLQTTAVIGHLSQQQVLVFVFPYSEHTTKDKCLQLQTTMLNVFTFLWAFFECLSTSLFIQAVLHSKFVTLDWFCKNVQRVMLYIPKPHNHQGTACFFAVLKPQNSWQSIRGRCVCQRSEESLLADIMANQLNSAPPRRRGRHRGIIVVALAFQAESL